VSRHVQARRLAQASGLDPRYLRRLRWIRKARLAGRAQAPAKVRIKYVLTDPEPDNFTYELANERELVDWVAKVAQCAHDQARALVSEPHRDPELADRLRKATAGHWWWSKAAPPFGKRVAWYALARLRKPTLMIETGVHDGLGSLLLLRALERNCADGTDGKLVSFDINPRTGWLVGSHPLWELRIESTRTGLPSLLRTSAPIGIFIHDSSHTYENERRELVTAASRLAEDGILLSDNAHVTRALADTCTQFGLEYLDFHERPRGHFYGGGIMAAGRAPAIVG